MNIVDYSEAYALHLRALEKGKGRERMRLLELAAAKFTKVRAYIYYYDMVLG